MRFIEENNLSHFDELNQLHEHTSAWRFAQKIIDTHRHLLRWFLLSFLLFAL